MLGNLHQIVVYVSSEVEIPDDKAEAYQNAMGNIEKYIKVIQGKKQEAENQCNELKTKIETLEMAMEELNENLDQMREQNEVIKNELKERAEEKNGQEIIEKEKFQSMLQEAEDLRTQVQGLQKEIVIKDDQLKQANEAISDKDDGMKKLRDELVEIANLKNEAEEDKNKLKTAYNDLKKRYINLQKSSKEEMKRLMDQVEELKEVETQASKGLVYGVSSHQSIKDRNESVENNEGEESSKVLSKDEEGIEDEENNSSLSKINPGEGLPTIQHKIEANLRIQEEIVAKLKEELEEKDNLLQEKERENESFKSVIKDLKKKRERALKKIKDLSAEVSKTRSVTSLPQSGYGTRINTLGGGGDSDQPGGSMMLTERDAEPENPQPNLHEAKGLGAGSGFSVAYNINPTKLFDFLKTLNKNLKKLYKDFINYSIMKEEEKMPVIQFNINQMVEALADFKEYSQAKIDYLKKHGYQV